MAIVAVNRLALVADELCSPVKAVAKRLVGVIENNGPVRDAIIVTEAFE